MGGEIGLLQEGDIIEINIPEHSVNAKVSDEEFAKLPPDVQRAVGSPNMLRTWAVVNYEELQTVIASNFKRDYRAIATQKKDFAQIPSSVKHIAITANLIGGQHGQ